MPNDVPVYNTLTSVETRLVQVMRRFMDTGLDDGEPIGGEPVYARIEIPLMRFIDLLWKTDPYAVALHHRLDYDVSIFELQFLYVITENRVGNVDIVGELLGWWFPATLIPDARAALNTVTKILNEEKIPLTSSARLREHILSVSSNRVRSGHRFVLGPDPANLSKITNDNKTIH